MIGINSDEGDRSDLQKKMKDEGINFRSAIDGSTRGPIATSWNVNGWPTVYVIDHNGVIQGKFLGFNKEKIDALVEKLVSEVK